MFWITTYSFYLVLGCGYCFEMKWKFDITCFLKNTWHFISLVYYCFNYVLHLKSQLVNLNLRAAKHINDDTTLLQWFIHMEFNIILYLQKIPFIKTLLLFIFYALLFSIQIPSFVWKTWHVLRQSRWLFK